MECFWGASKAAREARRYVSIVADLASRSLGGRVPGRTGDRPTLAQIRRSQRHAERHLDAPRWLDAIDVEAARAGVAGCDDGVIEH